MKGSEKINKLLEHFSLNPSDFAKVVGLRYAQNIYDIQKDKVDISKQIAAKITTAFPEINKNWLLTGEGEMMKIDKSENNVNGNNNISVAGKGNKVNSDVLLSIIELQKGYQEMMKASQIHLSESQTQMNRLLSIIEQLNNKRL
jgi:DNA-binding XRE family transcriptional regulator